MAGFLYFKPHHLAPVTRADIPAWGLGYAFPRDVAACMTNSNTPAAAPGHVFADPAQHAGRDVKMSTDEQVWRKLPKSDTWCGYWLDAKPTPAELARAPQIPGFVVTLAGDDWMIPLVRRFDIAGQKTVSNLPTYMECDDDGNWHRGPVLELHAHLWEVTRPIADALVAEYVEGKPPVVEEDAAIMACVVALLTTNYRVGPGELSLLRAFTTEANTHAACMAGCDWPTFMKWSESQKKTDPAEPDGSSMSAGDAALLPTTAQRGPTYAHSS